MQSETYTLPPSPLPPHFTHFPSLSLFLSPRLSASFAVELEQRQRGRNSTERIPPRIERHFVRIHGDAAHCTVISLQRTRPLVVRSYPPPSPPPNLIYRVTCLSREDIDRSLCVYGCGTSTSFPNIIEHVINPCTHNFF